VRPRLDLSAGDPEGPRRYRGEVSQPIGRGLEAFGRGEVEHPERRGVVPPFEGRAGLRYRFAKGGPVHRQSGGPYAGDPDVFHISHGARYVPPVPGETVVTAGAGGIPGAVRGMGLPIEENASQVLEHYTTPERRAEYFKAHQQRAKGGPVNPKKHHLLIIIGLQKRGLISEKAKKKRGL